MHVWQLTQCAHGKLGLLQVGEVGGGEITRALEGWLADEFGISAGQTCKV